MTVRCFRHHVDCNLCGCEQPFFGTKKATEAKRIFDNPNHPHYGPVRRLWVVLAQLDLLEAAERYGRHQKSQGRLQWDELLSELIRKHPRSGESAHQNTIIYTLLEGWQSC